ncbi:hypothetical protein LTS16_021328 [Friedmanniomyces endolithicus]|nr:hypothetical protein LTS16_021328 [Friedmanniomyces endolithicus]KAK1087289.1 hypothetical protein LTR33_001137 [Friedmanniomyces endolithicus]
MPFPATIHHLHPNHDPLTRLQASAPPTSPPQSSILRQLIQQMYTQNHNQQPNRNHNQQREPKPPQHHRARADSTPYAPVAEILRHLRRGYGGGMLPQHADEHEDGGDEN